MSVRVLRAVDGTRSVVSHHAKHARGLLIRHLMMRDDPMPVGADELFMAAKELAGTQVLDVELSSWPARVGPRELTLIVA